MGGHVNAEPQHEWLTTEEVADYLRVRPSTVRQWIRQGTLPALRVGGTRLGYRIRRSDLDRFIAKHYEGSEEDKR